MGQKESKKRNSSNDNNDPSVMHYQNVDDNNNNEQLDLHDLILQNNNNNIVLNTSDLNTLCHHWSLINTSQNEIRKIIMRNIQKKQNSINVDSNTIVTSTEERVTSKEDDGHIDA